MAYKGKNLRTMEVTPETGSDFRDTKVLSGTAPKAPQMNATNETNQYTTGTTSKGELGGKNTNS